MRYKLILADPPWKYNDASKNRGGAERHYPTMTPESLAALDILGLADARECALCVWVTFPQLSTALETIKAWGFSDVTCLFVWVKLNKVNKTPEKPFVGMGHYTRSNAEIMLLCRRGKSGKIPARQSKSIRQIQYFPVQEHSKKPPEFRDLLLELFGDIPRVELFARETVDGWDAWGNEVDPKDNVIVSPFDSFDESVANMLGQTKGRLKPLDYRAVCPTCYGHGEIRGSQSDDGGFLMFNCSCGFRESGQQLDTFKSSIRTIYKGMQ